MSNISIILGTRPEVVKLAPVVHEARARGHEVQVVTTGQHRELITPLLSLFNVKTDVDLDVMTADQTLTELSERILRGFNLHGQKIKKSDLLMVQGDTVTAWLGAYWGFCHQIPVAHVEAGLRTYDLTAPFPEEGNRQLIGRLANFHFAPTLQAAMALESEAIPQGLIYVVGNTSIDALNWVLGRIQDRPLTALCEVPPEVAKFASLGKFVVVTAHRRESFGPGLDGICAGVLGLVASVPHLRVIYPVHPNPQVRRAVVQKLGSCDRVLLCDPLPYVAFIALLQRAEVILTDSGGVQEEAPTLRRPILVLRDQTERPEGVQAGFAQLVGTDPGRIIDATQCALAQGLTTSAQNPYGDGAAATRIMKVLEESL